MNRFDWNLIHINSPAKETKLPGKENVQHFLSDMSNVIFGKIVL